MPTVNPDRAIERIARRQFGAFNVRQAKEVGFTHRMIDRRIRSGAWLRRARGVYALAAVRGSWDQRLMVGVLSEPVAHVCGRAACGFYELVGFGTCGPELVVPSSANHRSSVAKIRRSDDVLTTVVRGLPIVTPLQALFDIAGTVSWRELRRAAEDACARDIVDPLALAERVDHLAPTLPHGIADMRRLVEIFCDPTFVAPVTVLEQLLSEVLDEAGLPHVRQASFDWRAPIPMTVDSLVTDLRFIAEADGRTWHGRHRAQHVDRKRDRVALINGFDSMRFTRTMLTDERAETVQDLRTYAARRRAALAILDAHERPPAA